MVEDVIVIPSVTRPDIFTDRSHPRTRPADAGSLTALTMKRTPTPRRPRPAVVLKMARASPITKPTATIDVTTIATTGRMTRSRAALDKARATQPDPIIPNAANRVVSRAARPKAFDFWNSPIATSFTAAGEPKRQRQTQPSSSRTAEAGATCPPNTPRIPWDMYGIHDQSDRMLITQKPTGTAKVAMTRGKRNAMPEVVNEEKDEPTKHAREISRRDKHPPLPIAANVSKRRRGTYEMTPENEEVGDAEHQLDAHDPEMDDAYIPVGPGPMPRAPRLLKGLRKRRNRPRLGKGADSAPEDVISSGGEGTPPVTPATPASSLRKKKRVPPPRSVPSQGLALPEQPRKAGPEIWNLERRPTIQQGKGAWPPCQGNVYCETCFRDDCARWIRIRQGVMNILHLLGGDAAVGELRWLAHQADKARDELTYPDMVRDPDFPREALTSPPPPEYQPSSSESKGEEINVEHSIKKLTLLLEPDGSPRFHDSSLDARGLVLLCLLVERCTPGPDQSERDETSKILEALRKDIGLSAKQLYKLEVQCKELLVSPRKTTEPEVGQRGARPEANWWYWEFDEALQAAHQQHSPDPQRFSSFSRILAQKAEEAAIVSIINKAAAGVLDDPLDSHDHGSGMPQQGFHKLAQLEHVVGLDTPSDIFLARIGDKIAEARRDLTPKANKPADAAISPSQQPAAPTGRKRRRGTRTPDAETNLLPPAKRRRLGPLGNNSNGKRQYINPNPNPLPCLYCAESDASLLHPHPGADDTKPWVNPLMWSFNFTLDDAMDVETAEEFFELVTAGHGAQVQTVEVAVAEGGGGGMKFMVDVTGGETRIVLVEMRSVFEWVLGSLKGDGGRRRARFEAPVGVWEKWEGGDLRGCKYL